MSLADHYDVLCAFTLSDTKDILEHKHCHANDHHESLMLQRVALAVLLDTE